MASASAILRLCKVEFAYEATNDEELTVTEDALVFVLEDDDPEWWKVRIKTPAGESSTAPAEGLVPASYLVAAEPIGHVASLYAYEATNDEELTVDEDERLVLYEDEGDWALVGRPGGASGVGFMPSAWIERQAGAGLNDAPLPAADSYEDARSATPDAEDSSLTSNAAAAATSPTSASAAGKTARNVKTWSVTSIDAKKKKKKGTLGVGNGAVFFASESDKTPVQQYPLSSYVSHSIEKSKHLLINFGPDAELHFSIVSKDTLEEIVAKLESDRAAETEPVARSVPPPLASSTSFTSRPAPTSAFLPPPSRLAGSTSAPSPPRSPSPPPIADEDEHVPANGHAPSTAGHATALYDFDGEAADELSVREGERLLVVDGSSNEWWKVRRAEGDEAEGVVPASYVEVDAGVEIDKTSAAGALDEDVGAAAAAAEQKESDRREREQTAAHQRRADEARRMAEAARLRELRKPSAAVPAPPVVTAPPPAAPPRRLAAPTDSDRPKPAASKIRTWRDRTGQFKVDAEFLGVKDGKLRLHKSNGVIIEVPAEKMSNEDIQWLRQMRDKVAAGRKSGSAPVADDDDDVPLANARKSSTPRVVPVPSSARPSSSSAASGPSRSKRKEVDWFEFFLNAGCDMDDCTRYSHNFSRDKMDESVLPDLDASTLRTLGLREGDILRVMKHIRTLTGSLPTATDPSARDAEQIRKDEELARQLQAQDGAGRDGGGLFTSSSGALKSTRRGRPTTNRSAPSQVSSDLLGEASSRIATPPLPSKSPSIEVKPDGSRRSSSTAPTLIGGFDDDAWTVKSSSKPSTPVPPPAPTPPPVPTPAAPSTTAPPDRPASAINPQQAYNDGLLAGMGVQLPRPPSAPAPSIGAYARQIPTPQQPPPQPVQLGPRGPVAPVASNAPLLSPLVPTNTGFNTFIPTRPQPTGFQQPMPTGFQQMQPTGYQQPMQTGYQMPMQTGFVPSMPPPQQQPSPQPSFLAPQPTGYAPTPIMPQMTGFAAGGIRHWSPQPPAPPAAPTPPPMPTQSTPGDRYQPQNVFASMKTGQISQNANAQPQSEAKYDALRPQPTGFIGFTPQFGPGVVPQPTGFQPQQPMQQQQYGQPMQSQPTGFGQPGLYAQPQYRQY